MEFPNVEWSESESPIQVEAVVNASRVAGQGAGLTWQTRLLLEILLVLMCLGAVTGNILVIIIVAATKTFHCVTSVLIINLAISDLLVGVGVMPFVALSIMSHGWVHCADLCSYVGYTSSVYCTASVLTIAAIALDRYHSIINCLRYTSRCTLWRTCAVVLWIWLQALATSCPPLLGWSSVSYVVPMYSCAVNWASSPSYTALMAALSYLVPAVVILFCYVNIVKVARSHARRIHTLEGSVTRSQDPSSAFPTVHPSQQYCGRQHSPAELLFHVSGNIISHFSRDDGNCGTTTYPASTTELTSSSSRRLLSLFSQSACQPHNTHGVVRLFLVISAFFLCWTPYIGVALVQATETAISRQASLVPPSAITFSYWLVLLNSDINPLLYALLSKRFQGALQGLRQKLRDRLGVAVSREREVRQEGYEGTSSDPCTLTTNHPGPPSRTESYEESKYCSSVFTVSSEFIRQSNGQRCTLCHSEYTPPPCAILQNSGHDRTVDCLQVPSRPHEGGRLPFSGLTKERQATFFYGQITVRVEHDVC